MMRGVMDVVPRSLCLGLWAAFILVASFLPKGLADGVARAMTLNGRTFVPHMVAYSVLGVLIFLALTGKPFARRAVAMLCVPVVLGGLIELLQPLVGRGCHWQDVLANTLGAVFSFAAVALWALLAGKGARPRWQSTA